jgi:hypothetical protein
MAKPTVRPQETEKLTISQLNKIGERLRKGRANDDDVRRLDLYISSFTPAFDHVFNDLTQSGLNPGGRPHKTTPSIVAKLNRERSRLSKIQDIAGCRIEVPNRVEQDRIAAQLQAKYSGAKLQDRREHPSHGYRAVHLIVAVSGRLVEIQIRTPLQHEWASVTEKLADLFDDITIKYGGGPDDIQQFLHDLSACIADVESFEAEYLSDPAKSTNQRMLERFEIHKARLRKLCERSIITFGARVK